jgi:hypothetical protein
VQRAVGPLQAPAANSGSRDPPLADPAAAGLRNVAVVDEDTAVPADNATWQALLNVGGSRNPWSAGGRPLRSDAGGNAVLNQLLRLLPRRATAITVRGSVYETTRPTRHLMHRC